MSIRLLSSALRKKAEEEINESPSNVDSELKILRKWVNEQPRLSSLQTPDQWLIAFLRGCKYNTNKAKEKLKAYYDLNTNVPEVFTNRDPMQNSIQDILKTGFFLPLKKCTSEDSPKTCLVRPAAFNGSKHRLTDLIKVSMMIIEILLLEDDNFTVVGEEVIVDVKNLSLSIMAQWTPMLARRIMIAAEKALSIRLKSIHILNAPPGFAAFFAIFKIFLGSKLKNRIHFHNKGYDSLFKFVNRSILPIEYGGTEENLEEATGNHQVSSSEDTVTYRETRKTLHMGVLILFIARKFTEQKTNIPKQSPGGQNFHSTILICRSFFLPC